MFRHGELWRRVHAFGNEVAQTDDSVIVEATRTSALPHSKQINLGLLWGPRFESKQMINSYLITFLGVHAFGNEIAQTDDFVIVEATRTSALPHSKQINLGLFWGTIITIGRTLRVCSGGPDLKANRQSAQYGMLCVVA